MWYDQIELEIEVQANVQGISYICILPISCALLALSLIKQFKNKSNFAVLLLFNIPQVSFDNQIDKFNNSFVKMLQ